MYFYGAAGNLYYRIGAGTLRSLCRILIGDECLPAVGGVRKRHALAILKSLWHAAVHPSSARVLRLPVEADVCVPVHRGYKLFDYRRGTVTKMFSSSTDDAAMAREIEGVASAAELYFAPRLVRLEPSSRWYSEELLQGAVAGRAHDALSGVFIEHNAGVLVQLLIEMVCVQDEQRVVTQHHLQRRLSELYARVHAADVSSDVRAQVLGFVDQVLVELTGMSDEMLLIYSHGDFSLVNIIICSPQQLRVIDWEGAERRSALYDLCNMVTTECYYDRMTLSAAVATYRSLVSLVLERLESTQTSLRQELISHERLYRYFYYLERIGMLLEREHSTNLFDVVQRSIEVFRRFEGATVDVIRSKKSIVQM